LETFARFLLEDLETRIRRMNARLRGGGQALEITTEVQENEYTLRLVLRTKDEKGSLVIPKSRKDEHGNQIIGDQNHRTLCPFMVIVDGAPRHKSYSQMIAFMLGSNLEQLFPEQGKRSHLDKILYGFLKGNGRLATSLCQRFLNQNLFNMLPLSGTPLQDYAMNRRLMIFDPIFATLNPEDKLAYQTRKNELLHPWGSIGLSDGAAATNNYILQDDLRRYTAFGSAHHNPLRNLYSTLGMKGEQTPLVISKSAERLEKRGIVRSGWNLLTAFIDLPLNFEDQLLVSRRLAGKQVSYQRSFVIFGCETVEVGDTIVKGRILGQNEDDSYVTFDVDCDHAKVVAMRDSTVPFDGSDMPVRIVILEVFFSFKEGFKLTNQHGNKGIVILEDLGTMHDPVRGDIPIDIIVSASSVQRRKNYGQILEALTTLISGPEKKTIVSDDVVVDLPAVENTLERAGYSRNGTCPTSTPWGNFDAVCGWVHWGVTKTPEEQLWSEKDTWSENQRGMRTKGNKLSVVEMKALTTLLGPGSHTVNEILSYKQGTAETVEYLRTIDTLRGNYQDDLPVIQAESFIYLPAGMGTFHAESRLAGTIADETMYPNGGYLQLPFTLRVLIPNDRKNGEIMEGVAGENAYTNPDSNVFETDRLMIPSANLRQPWQHPTGLMGLSDVATMLNQIIEGIDRLGHGEIKEAALATLIYRYLRYVGKSLSMKQGKISQNLMSVRYPWSSKATAVLGRDLEPNWVEIHRDMAADLKVQTGDYVLVERFPCLGFMSTRIQRVRVTDDPEAKYVIRVSGNSLVSMNLDFDGDVIYIMSFHSDGSKKELQENFHNPHPRVAEVLDQMNNRKQPLTRAMTLQEIGLQHFKGMTPQEHAALNKTSLAVKLYTGPVIALCYNLQRIIEAHIPYTDREAHINAEVFLDKVGNSVFSQKHGTVSLREECTRAVCLADVGAMVKLGFPAKESQQLCQIIRSAAAKLGVRSDSHLREVHRAHVEEGRSSIINQIVRRQHRTYFATRSNLHPIDLLEHLETKPVDLVGHLVQLSLGGYLQTGRKAAAVA